MRALTRLFGLAALTFLATACSDASDSNPAEDDAALSGGATTVFDATSGAFGQPAPNLSAASLAIHTAGDGAFESNFVTAPAPVNPGLGPLFNNRSCAGCHVSDGRGRPPIGNEPFLSMLFRLSVPGTDADGGPLAAPDFGLQLQARAIQGTTPEANVQIAYTDDDYTFGDGDPYSLHAPAYTIVTPYTALPANLLSSPRVAPANFGLGLLEAIPEATIVANADPNDLNGDGISGRPNYVHDALNGGTALGRFGLKANVPNLVQQTAGAYNGDMGVTSPQFPDENCAGQSQCVAAHAPEVTDSIVQAVAFYVRTLGVPARRNLSDPQAKQGEQLFKQAGCTGCHIQTLTTGTFPGIPEISNQRIHPYTDLLLHDMGPELADNRPDFEASGSEWRTAPLWGVGLTLVVNGHTNFLHDGRARSLLEAVMWHGGEAAAARDQVKNFTAAERAALVKFLESL
jgi:CxxC motif-containing protein (DUF1111 family)